jgi:hypothetical protein
MRTKHVYASVDLLKEYLAGDGFDSDWTQDETVLRRLLESASVTIENHMGGRGFAPFTATREYDLGSGRLRSRSELPQQRDPNSGDFTAIPIRGVIPLADWLSAVPTTVTAYDDSDRGSNTVLTEGLANDYILEPYSQAPYHTLKLTENTNERLHAGQKTLTILGAWGWQADTELTDNAINDVANINSTQTTITYDGTGNLSAGEILLIDTEQIYVRSLSTTVLTVTRGVNGTTAATHADDATISRYLYPSDVVEACLSIARDRYTSREAGATASIGTGVTITRPGASQRAVLKSLDYYRQERDLAGVYF